MLCIKEELQVQCSGGLVKKTVGNTYGPFSLEMIPTGWRTAGVPHKGGRVNALDCGSVHMVAAIIVGALESKAAL